MHSPETLDLLRRDVLRSLHCALPGIVETFDPETRTACIRPALRSKAPDGSTVAYPLLRDVPVFFPGDVLFAVNPGDECLLIFADTAIDGWFETGGAVLPPSDRQHALSDAFAFVGFRSKARQEVIP